VLTEMRQQTQTAPIVFVNVVDPVEMGYVASLAHPGANITGFTNIETSVIEKWLEILRDMAPHVTNVSVILDRRNPNLSGMLRVIERVAPAFGFRLTPVVVENVADVSRGIEAVGREPNGGLVVVQSIFIGSQVDLIVGLAAQYRVPTIYPYRYFVSGGGLMSYSVDLTGQMRQAADYVDRILRGEKPADLPVQQPSKFELVINLKTAKALGLTVPPSLLARADEVIE
jgi:putative ABC transport system substrate-binding protein